jgi:hypothetical protein
MDPDGYLDEYTSSSEGGDELPYNNTTLAQVSRHTFARHINTRTHTHIHTHTHTHTHTHKDTRTHTSIHTQSVLFRCPVQELPTPNKGPNSECSSYTDDEQQEAEATPRPDLSTGLAHGSEGRQRSSEGSAYSADNDPQEQKGPASFSETEQQPQHLAQPQHGSQVQPQPEQQPDWEGREDEDGYPADASPTTPPQIVLYPPPLPALSQAASASPPRHDESHNTPQSKPPPRHDQQLSCERPQLPHLCSPPSSLPKKPNQFSPAGKKCVSNGWGWSLLPGHRRRVRVYVCAHVFMRERVCVSTCVYVSVCVLVCVCVCVCV